MDLPSFIWTEVFENLIQKIQGRFRLVSKRWNAILVPVVFKTINVSGKSSERAVAATNKFYIHVRHLSVYNVHSCAYELIPRCTHITHLYFEYKNAKTLKYLLALGETLPRLKHLTLIHFPSSSYKLLEKVTSKVSSLDLVAKPKKGKKLKKEIWNLVCPIIKNFGIECEQLIWDRKFFLFLLSNYPTLEKLQRNFSVNIEDVDHFTYDVLSCKFLHLGFQDIRYPVHMELFLKDTKALLPPQDVRKAHELQAAKLFDFQFKKDYPSLPMRFKDIQTAKLHIIGAKKVNQLFENLTEAKQLKIELYDALDDFVPLYKTFKAQRVFIDWTTHAIWLWLANCFPNLTDLYIDFPEEFPEDEINPFNLKSVKTICLFNGIETYNWRKIINNAPNLTQVLISNESQVTELAKEFPKIFFGISSQYIKFNYDLEEDYYDMCSSEFESSDKYSDLESN